MKFKVLSRTNFKKFIFNEPCIVISIIDPNSEKIEYKDNDNLRGLIELSFYDLDEDTEVFPYSKFIFNTDQAKRILNFVKLYKDEVDLIIIHCEAGISRSAGVAGALSLIYNSSDKYFFDNYIPNMLVYRTILNQYMENYNANS